MFSSEFGVSLQIRSDQKRFQSSISDGACDMMGCNRNFRKSILAGTDDLEPKVNENI